MKCSRCGDDVKRTAMIVRPGGHTWFVPSNSDFTKTEPPRTEYVCGGCITDHELLMDRTIGDVVLFATDVLMKGALPEDFAPLETVRAHFMVYNLQRGDEESRHRNAALRAIGLFKEPIDFTTKNEPIDKLLEADLTEQMSEVRWSLSEAARLVGISRPTLYRYLKELGYEATDLTWEQIKGLKERRRLTKRRT